LIVQLETLLIESPNPSTVVLITTVKVNFPGFSITSRGNVKHGPVPLLPVGRDKVMGALPFTNVPVSEVTTAVELGDGCAFWIPVTVAKV
jgi:hypothetical protein